MNTHLYPSDLTDEEWAILGPLITPGRQAGHPQVLELRRVVDAVFYLLRAGCQWRALPHDFPPWAAVFYHYAKWRRRGTWERINAALRERHRLAIGRQVQPTAAILDSQSVRSLLKARVHPADIHDRSGAPLLLAGLDTEFPRIALVWADTAYQGLKAWMADVLGWRLTISKHWWTGLRGVWVAPGQQPPEIPRGFHVLKRRWVVERTFAWIGRNRRMSRDFERLIRTSEMLLYAAMARVTLRRLAKRTN
jgi:putative transposase